MTGQAFIGGSRIANESETFSYSIVDDSTIKILVKGAVTESGKIVDQALEYTLSRYSSTSSFRLEETDGVYSPKHNYSIAEAPEWVSDRNTVQAYFDLARHYIPNELLKIYDKAPYKIYGETLKVKLGVQNYYHEFVPPGETLLYVATNPFIVDVGYWSGNEGWLYGYSFDRSWMVSMGADQNGKVRVYFRIIEVLP